MYQMDTRSIDEADQTISFDLLRQWVGSVFCRSVGDVEPLGCGWGTVTMAMQNAGAEVTEHTLRQCIVHGYMTQSSETVKAIIQAKRRASSLFRQVVGDESRWPWYLCCLSYAESLDEDMVRMPLDMVDLQIVAACLSVSITVSQLMCPAIRIEPPGVTKGIHLAHHRGLWAPLLSPRPPEQESQQLLSAVVQLSNSVSRTGFDLRWHGADGKNCIGAVLSYDADQECYVVCVGWRKLLVERSQITRLVYHPSVEPDRDGEDTVLRGIPDSSFEWQLLHELVRREARAKLELMMQQLAGREVAPARPHLPKDLEPVPEFTEEMHTECPMKDEGDEFGDGLVVGQKELHLRLAFDAMVSEVEHGEICVFAVTSFQPGRSGQLTLHVGDEVRVRRVSGEWVLATAGGALAWCPRDSLTLWEAVHPFRPEGDSLLSLDVGDTVVLTRRYAGEWVGWGYGFRWSDKRSAGLLRLSCIEPMVLVSQWKWEM